jgi:hypothetical protein
MSGDWTTRDNTSLTLSHFSPIYFYRINVNTSFLMFLRLATSCFLSFLPAISHLLHSRFSQRCFWGFIASWMQVSVYNSAPIDVSNDRCYSLLRVKMERNRWIKLEHNMKILLFYLTIPTSILPQLLCQTHGRWAEWTKLIRWVIRQ